MSESPEISKMSIDALCDVLSALQERITKTPYEEEATLLSGSYGVHLHYLRQKDSKRAENYVEWMKNYRGC